MPCEKEACKFCEEESCKCVVAVVVEECRLGMEACKLGMEACKPCGMLAPKLDDEVSTRLGPED